MSDTEEDDMDASYEADNPELTKEISLNETALTENSILDETFDSTAGSFCSEPDVTSTPTKPKRTSKRKGKGQQTEPAQPGPSKAPASNFKVPKPPAVIIGRCPECGKGLKTLPGLNNHILAHKWKDLARRQPDISELQEYCVQQCCSNILPKIAADRAGGKYGPAFNLYVEKLILKQESKEWESFSRSVSEQLCETFGSKPQPTKTGKKQPTGKAFASSLRSDVQQNINKILSDKEKRDDLIDALFQVEIATTEVAYPFLMVIMQKVGNSALIFTFRSMTGRVGSLQEERRKRSKDNFNSLKAQKLVHYISGSCVRSYLRHACRHPKNKKLQMVKNVIMTRFVQAPPTVAEKTDRSYWTKTLNRKAFFFVNDNAFEFFLELAKLLQRMELKDGSVGHEAVMDKVVETPELLFKWDMIVGSTLDEDHSFSFMVKVIRTLSNTFGVGVLKRRMNVMWKKGKGNKNSISVSHRARVLK